MYRDLISACRFCGVDLQEKDTEKILYGLDDIKDASDIIIVVSHDGTLLFVEVIFAMLLPLANYFTLMCNSVLLILNLG